MAEYLIQDTTLTGIADAIRSKTGSTGAIKVSDMASKIEGISVGGGTVEGVHYVTFMSQDGTTELYKRVVADGDDCADPVERGLIDAPTKESTAQYDYSFVGWATTPNGAWDETALDAVTEDKTVYAVFASAVRYYTITFYDDDGVTVLATKSFAYGSTPSYTPTKDGSVFVGWNPELTSVTGDASYTASWTDFIASGTLTTGVTWALTAGGVLDVSGEGAMDDYTYNSGVQSSPWADYATNIKSVVVREGVTTIGAYAFAFLTQLTSATIPKSVTAINTGALRASGLSGSLSVSDAVKTIGGTAFYQTELTDVTIGSGVTSIGGSAFAECYSLTDVTIGSGVTSIGSNFLFNCKNLSGVTFEDTSTWYTANSSGVKETQIDVTNPSTNATNLRSSASWGGRNLIKV